MTGEASDTSAAEREGQFPCVVCGYDLRGFDDERLCPECGGNVGASHRERSRRASRFGPSLRLRGEPWLLWAAAGFTLYVLGTLMWVGVASHGPRDPAGEYRPVVWGLLLLTELVLWLGAWWMSAKPQIELRHARLLRLSFRVLVTVWLIAHGAFLVAKMFDPQATFGGDYLAVVRRWAAALATVAGFGWFANIAGRLDFLTVRRFCIAASVTSLLLVYAAAQKHWIDGMPNIAGIALPYPLQPLLGSIDVHLDLSRFVMMPDAWPHLWRHALAGVAWLVSALSIVQWFALAVGFQAVKYRREMKERGTVDGRARSS